MAGDNDADGKECIKEGFTDKDYKQPDAYVPGPGSKSSGKGDAKEKDDGY